MAKQYQNVSYKELLSYSENNPNRTRTLDSIRNIKIQDTSLKNIGLPQYNSYNLNPTGPISLIACINDSMYYSLAAPSMRTQLIIDLATSLQEKTNELKNTSISRKRKKICELISAAYNGSLKEEKEYFELFSGLSVICNVQFVLVKSSVQENIEEGTIHNGIQGEIVFASNPTNWKSDIPVWIVDYHARWVAIPSDKINTHTIIGNWLADIESTGWIIKWPDVDMTKTELVEYLSQSTTWQETDRKLTKDVLSARLGRSNCISVFYKWVKI